MKRFLAAASLLTLAACTTVGPDYVSPAPTAPAQTPFIGAAWKAFSAEAPPSEWWRLYGDATLDRLVAEALTANTDLRVAEANLRQARAGLRETQTQRLPSTGVGASATTGRTLDDTSETYDVGIDVSYQVDLFGRIRRAIEGAAADAESVAATRDLVAITVAADTARAYADACAAGDQLRVARRSLAVQEQTLGLTRLRFEGGIGTALDVASTAALVETTRAAIPSLESERRASLYRLAVLTGRPPGQAPAEAEACVSPPRLTTPLPVGDGAALMARRPDIRQAERSLAARTANIGVRTAELYPSVSLGLSAGSTAGSLGDLSDSAAFNYSLGPLISWTIPNQAAARARIRQAQAQADAALATFDGTWLGALEETESALARYAGELDRQRSLVAALARSGEAAELARLRYRAGAESYLAVLDAERTLAEAETAKAQSDAQLSTRQISVFLALGGGWEAVRPPPALAAAPPAPRPVGAGPR